MLFNVVPSQMTLAMSTCCTCTFFLFNTLSDFVRTPPNFFSITLCPHLAKLTYNNFYRWLEPSLATLYRICRGQKTLNSFRFPGISTEVTRSSPDNKVVSEKNGLPLAGHFGSMLAKPLSTDRATRCSTFVIKSRQVSFFS